MSCWCNNTDNCQDCWLWCSTPLNTCGWCDCPNIIGEYCTDVKQWDGNNIIISTPCIEVVSTDSTVDITKTVTEWLVTFDLSKECCPDRLAAVTACDTNPWYIYDKILVSSPLTKSLNGCNTMTIGLNVDAIPTKDEKVKVSVWCNSGYLSELVEWDWYVTVTQNGCKMRWWINTSKNKRPIALMRMNTDHQQFYDWNNGWAAALPNQWWYLPRNFTIYESNTTGDIPMESINVSSYGGTQFPTNWLRITKKWWYRISLMGSADINNCINACRFMIAKYSTWGSVSAPQVILDSKYWAPSNLPLSETPTYSIDPNGNHLKQYEFGGTKSFLLEEWDVIFAYGRMDTYVTTRTTGNQGLVVWRHAWLSWGNLWWITTSLPVAWAEFEVEWISDENWVPFFQ